jgi:hypothetical protein
MTPSPVARLALCLFAVLVAVPACAPTRHEGPECASDHRKQLVSAGDHAISTRDAELLNRTASEFARCTAQAPNEIKWLHAAANFHFFRFLGAAPKSDSGGGGQQLKHAVAYYERAHRLAPADLVLCTELGYAHLSSSAYAAAAAVFEECLALEQAGDNTFDARRLREYIGRA